MAEITHFYISSVLQGISKKLHNALAEANQVATETFSQIKTVKSFANEDGETEKYRRRLDDIYSLNKMESGAYALSMWSSTVSAQTSVAKIRALTLIITRNVSYSYCKRIIATIETSLIP